MYHADYNIPKFLYI